VRAIESSHGAQVFPTCLKKKTPLVLI
jgi:hypothetical protein